MKPAFIIIGGVKCASSSLYRYLNFHPQVLPCKTKEPGFFNNRNPLKLLWRYKRYINLFPSLNQSQVVGDWLDLGKDDKMHPSKFTKEIKSGKKYITGEATANTHTLANPKLVKMFLPKVKLILLLSKEIAAYRSGQPTRILSQGMYMNELPNWKKSFGDNLRLYKTKSFNSPSANTIMNEICAYLEIDAHDFNPILKTKYNSTGKSIEHNNSLEKLQEFYAPQVAALHNEYGINLTK